jgi:hypothetical protein
MTTYQEATHGAPSILSEIERLERELAASERLRFELLDDYSSLRLDHATLQKVSAGRIARLEEANIRLRLGLESLKHAGGCACAPVCSVIDGLLSGARHSGADKKEGGR